MSGLSVVVDIVVIDAVDGVRVGFLMFLRLLLRL